MQTLVIIYPPFFGGGGFPGGASGKNLPPNAGDVRDAGSVPGSRRSPGEGNGHPLQYSCLENPMEENPWRISPEEPGGLQSMGPQRVGLKRLSMHASRFF